jgi:hypothetical protein
MNRRAPFGFCLASLFAALFGMMMLVVFVMADGGSSDMLFTLCLRMGAAALAALSGVAVEALLFARRWAYPATLALALAYAAGVAALCVYTRGSILGLFAALIILVVSAMVVLPIVFFVRDASINLFGIPRQRAAPPQPVMRPAPPRPGGPPQPWW